MCRSPANPTARRICDKVRHSGAARRQFHKHHFSAGMASIQTWRTGLFAIAAAYYLIDQPIFQGALSGHEIIPLGVDGDFLHRLTGMEGH